MRLVKELKDSLDLERGPVLTDPKIIKYLLQNVIITYRTLEQAHSPEILEHAEPLIADMTQTFLEGLFNPCRYATCTTRFWRTHWCTATSRPWRIITPSTNWT